MIAATITRDGATLQVQAFAAPRTTGIWDDIRHDLTESVASQGGKVEVYAGVFGAEMLTRLPAVTPDGKRGERIARFVGVDGPRWFLRGVISGAAVLGDEAAAASVEEVFRDVVVDRGDDPRPPRELLPMTLRLKSRRKTTRSSARCLAEALRLPRSANVWLYTSSERARGSRGTPDCSRLPRALSRAPRRSRGAGVVADGR